MIMVMIIVTNMMQNNGRSFHSDNNIFIML